MKSRLLIIGNIAAFEYPPTDRVEEFYWDEKGVLFIHGYTENPFSAVFGKPIDCAKRFVLNNISGYKIVGRLHEAEKIVSKDFSALLKQVDTNRAVFFIKQ